MAVRVAVCFHVPEASRLAARFLPPTNLRFGRPAEPETCWCYQAVDGSVPTERYRDGEETTLVEILDVPGYPGRLKRELVLAQQ